MYLVEKEPSENENVILVYGKDENGKFRRSGRIVASSSLYLVKKNRMKIGKCNNITWKRRKMERVRKTIDYVARAGSWAAAGC